MSEPTSRRSFLKSGGLGAAILGFGTVAKATDRPKIQGFEEEVNERKTKKGCVNVENGIKLAEHLGHASHNGGEKTSRGWWLVFSGENWSMILINY